MTDGLENTSKEFNQTQIFDLIKRKENEGNWTFVYLGANQDSFAVGGSLGFARGNTINYTSTSDGHTHAMRNLSRSTINYVGQSLATTSSFFDKTGEDN